MTPNRDPDRTRTRILHAAFDEMYRRGFRAASLDDILQAAGVTKGALYHHFRNKTALGYAVVEEVIGEWIQENWGKALQPGGDPIDALLRAFDEMHQPEHAGEPELGCPLNNLAQEMSNIDEGFRLRLEAIVAQWRSILSQALLRGQSEGTVRADLDAEATAAFIVAAIEGMAGAVKNAGGIEGAALVFEGFRDYVRRLRALEVPAP